MLGRLDGFRLAEPGEFTRRAFENGRLDLTAVEGLADLIGAETEAQRRQALRQFQGLMGDRAETWRGRLIEALALVEAGIDFSDEGDVPARIWSRARSRSSGHWPTEIAAGRRGQGERLREGLRSPSRAPPNVGKSTLLNRLARREAAIVSPHAGTTRDVIEVHLDLAGFPVMLRDTAGLRDSRRSGRAGGRAARLECASRTPTWCSGWWMRPGSRPAGRRRTSCRVEAQRWIVLNKADLLAPDVAQEMASRSRAAAGRSTRVDHIGH